MSGLLAPLASPSSVFGIPIDPTVLLIGVTAVALVAFIALAVALVTLRRMYREARRVPDSGSDTLRPTAAVVPGGVQPLTIFRRDGLPADPLNLRVVGTARQLGAAFSAAGWYRADEITAITATRIALGVLVRAKYSTAPVSTLYLYDRRQDFAFERPGRNVHERNHIRLWDSGERAEDGRPVWVGAATRDVAVKLSPTTGRPTHQIAPDVDAERSLVADDLIRTGWVLDVTRALAFDGPTIRDNGEGDTYFTDGEIVILTLADMPVIEPFPTTHVRGPFAAGVAKRVSRAFAWRLPGMRAGRARELAQRVARRARETAPLRRRGDAVD